MSTQTLGGRKSLVINISICQISSYQRGPAYISWNFWMKNEFWSLDFFFTLWAGLQSHHAILSRQFALLTYIKPLFSVQYDVVYRFKIIIIMLERKRKQEPSVSFQGQHLQLGLDNPFTWWNKTITFKYFTNSYLTKLWNLLPSLSGQALLFFYFSLYKLFLQYIQISDYNSVSLGSYPGT